MTWRALPALLALVRLFALALPLEAQGTEQPFVGNPEVLIKLVPQGPDAARKLAVGPRGVGLCRHREQCGDTVTFTWVGTAEAGEKVLISFLDGEAAASCFGKATEILEAPGPQASKSLTAEGDCGTKRAFFYAVSCIGGKGGNCGGIAVVDPGVLVEGGG